MKRWLGVVGCCGLLGAGCKQYLELVSLTTNCVIDGQTYNAGELEPGTLNRCCRPDIDRNSWTDWFKQPVTYPFTIGPTSIAAADLQNRGTLDLAVLSNRNLDVYKNELDAGFGLLSSNTATGDTLLVGDLNGDGLADIVTLSGQMCSGACQAINVSLADLTEPRGFAAPNAYTTKRPTQTGVLADFNHDGTLDLAVALIENALCIDRVQIFWNQPDDAGVGSGVLVADPVTIPVGCWPHGMAVGDLNGDGWPDLAVVNARDGGVSVLLNNGAATNGAAIDGGWFTPADALSIGPTGWDVVLADLYGKGKLDVVVTQNNSAAIYTGHGDATFDAPMSIPTVASDTHNLAVADFDNDGVSDLAVGTFLGTITVVRPSTPAAPIVLHTVLSVSALVAGDFDLDGRVDLAAADEHNNAVMVYSSNCSGKLE